MKLLTACLLWCLGMDAAQAASFQLVTQGNEPLYQTTLDLAVYQQSRREHLQDITIQNAEGESLPYALLPYAALNPKPQPQTAQSLDVYPVRQDDLKQAGAVQFQLDKITHSADVNIGTKAPDQAAKIVYLVDAGEQHAPLQVFEATWQGSQNKLIAMEILSSNDLSNWLKIGDAALLSTEHDGQKILQNTITLNALSSARYLQIKPINILPEDAFKLTGIQAIYHSETAANLPMLWQSTTLMKRAEDRQSQLTTIDFEAPGPYAASYLRIQLPQPNTISYVSVRARDTRHAPWMNLAQAPVYNMTRNGHLIHNSDLIINPTTARYWQLVFSQRNGGIGNQNPSLQLGWLPDTLVWHARGKSPFTLKVGENPSSIDATSIRYLLPDDNANHLQDLPKAILRDAPQQGTVSGWQAIVDAQPWLLYLGLVTGVLALAGLAYWLFRSKQNNS